jgi:hypothetical protein
MAKPRGVVDDEIMLRASIQHSFCHGEDSVEIGQIAGYYIGLRTLRPQVLRERQSFIARAVHMQENTIAPARQICRDSRTNAAPRASDKRRPCHGAAP